MSKGGVVLRRPSVASTIAQPTLPLCDKDTVRPLLAIDPRRFDDSTHDRDPPEVARRLHRPRPRPRNCCRTPSRANVRGSALSRRTARTNSARRFTPASPRSRERRPHPARPAASPHRAAASESPLPHQNRSDRPHGPGAPPFGSRPRTCTCGCSHRTCNTSTCTRTRSACTPPRPPCTLRRPVCMFPR